MKKKILLLTFILTTVAFSQKKQFNLKWDGVQTISSGKFTIEVPKFNLENFNYSLDKGLQFIHQWSTNSFINESTARIENIVYQPISKRDLKGLNVTTIPNDLEFSLKNTFARDKQYAFLMLSPIVRNANGSYKKVVSFSINYSLGANTSKVYNNKTEITNSVLTSGTWYRFYVDASGVFKLSKPFLERLGLNTNLVDPRTLKLYGNGGQMLPYANAVEYPLDMQENAIKIVGEEDGIFNNEDYILFYAIGPKGNVNDSRINTNINPYTDKSYYYINVSAGNGKRIQPFFEPSGTPNLDINTFQDYKFHEIDEYNLVNVGRRWFGDKFDVENAQTFEFLFPDLIPAEPVKFSVYVAATSDTASSMEVGVNGSSIINLTLPGADDPNFATENSYVADINVTSPNIAVNLNYNNQGNPSASGYLDYISIEATRALNFSGNQMVFKNNEVATMDGVGQYTLTNSQLVSEVWDISDLYNVSSYPNNEANSTITFKSALGSLKTYVAVTPFDYYEPLFDAGTVIFNQNLKGTIFNNAQGEFQDIDYIIVAPNIFYSQAERLAQINRNKYNLNVKVVTLNEVYNEFSSGNQDIGAIRNLIKYVYDNASVPENRVKYVCLFGDASFDYKDRIPNNTNIVPSWNAYESFNLTNSFITDDFYGMMDVSEGDMNVTDKLDIAVGRILADSPQRANELINKIESYYIEEAFG